jgi:hypothetical protein
MSFEWDESKRYANILKHRVDFIDAVEVFENRFLESEDRRRDYGERRFRVFGYWRGTVLHVVYTWRGERRRIITARRAKPNERRTYYAGIAEAGPQDEE